MKIFATLALFVGLLTSMASTVTATPVLHRQVGSNSSLSPPTTQLPFPVSYYQILAGLSQETFCPSQNKPGLKIGDAVLLNTTGNGDTQQRVNVYHSKSLGTVVAYMVGYSHVRE